MESSVENKIPESFMVTKVKRPIFLMIFLVLLLLSVFVFIVNTLITIYSFKDLYMHLSSLDILLRLADQGILIVLFIIIPVLLLSALTASDIASPVKEIGNSIKQIAKGNFNIRLQTKRDDELGNLMQLFNTMTEQLKEVEGRNAEIAKIKSKFITVASHQLRTPSSGVGLGLETLLSGDKGPLTAEQKQLLEECYTRNLEMIQTVNNLVYTSDMEEGKFNYEYRYMEVDTIVKTMIGNFALKTKIRNTPIVYKNELTEPVKIILDENKISMVFANIVENALEYGDKDKQIDIVLKKEGEELVIEISNEGIGISEEESKKIFTQFFRGENALKRKPNGIGLSLHICKRIVEAHRGSISVASIENGKTTFTVRLPINKELIIEKPKVEDFFESI